MTSLAVALLVIIIDQTSKFLVRANLSQGNSFSLINGVFSITNVRNPGGAFGLLPNQQWLFMLVSLLVVVAMVIFFIIKRPQKLAVKVSLGLAAGGALGNLIDRIFFGLVTDFLDFHFWPVFNLADSSIVIGLAILLFVYLREAPQAKPS